jgi:2,4-dichlorophenol 6-monooxygenase
LPGEEIGRMKSWGNHPLSKAEHLLSSPTMMNDLPQTFMEPILFKTACSRGTQAGCRPSISAMCRMPTA